MKNSVTHTPPDEHKTPEQWFFSRTRDIVAIERREYLIQRRKQLGLKALPDAPAKDDHLVGLTISGGGVRSATLGLGLLRTLISTDKLKHFDYLSTVSGGGYIGSCLSSLMSAEEKQMGKGDDPTTMNDNKRFDPKIIGLQAENSPFVRLDPNKMNSEKVPVEASTLTAAMQIDHLRRHGEYLTPRKKVFSWDIFQAIGSVLTGSIFNVLLFFLVIGVAVGFHLFVFSGISGGNFLTALVAPPGWNDLFDNGFYDQQSLMEQLRLWSTVKLGGQLNIIATAMKANWPFAVAMILLGALVAWSLILYSRSIPYKIAVGEHDEKAATNPEDYVAYDRRGGTTVQSDLSGRFTFWFWFLSVVLGPALAILAVWLGRGWMQGDYPYVTLLGLPLCFGVGYFFSIIFLTGLRYLHAPERVSGRLYRYFYTGMQGSALYGLLWSAVFPVLMLLQFGDNSILLKLFLGWLPAGAAYYVALQKFAPGGILDSISQRIREPLLNISMLLLIGLAGGVMFRLEKLLGQGFATWFHTDVRTTYTEFQLPLCGVLFVFIVLTLLTVALGIFADTNDLSLHYFYRDRLSETYLRTEGRLPRTPMSEKFWGPDGRLARNEGDPTQFATRQNQRPRESLGLPEVNVRNHENLLLSNVGRDNGRGPYHIIIGALNLQGSTDLAKKTLKSDHFIFSKYFIGSRTTGFIRTEHYRNNTLRLNQAMTISAAAMATGMGTLSFTASYFYMSLLNLRTGYWIDNPWTQYRDAKLQALRDEEYRHRPPAYRFGAFGKALVTANGKRLRRVVGEGVERFKWRFPKHDLGKWWTEFTGKNPFWLRYLGMEMAGRFDSKSRRIYVSDGGHTGDNLAIIPLLERRCKTIVVADFEEDNNFTFGSLSSAIRLAAAVRDIRIELKLDDLLPDPNTPAGRIGLSKTCVVEGQIHYPNDKEPGKFIYLKSAVCLGPESDVPTCERAPVYVLNYWKNNPGFPHQSTADQYFDEEQFEAHMQLGEHIGQQALGHLKHLA